MAAKSKTGLTAEDFEGQQKSGVGGFTTTDVYRIEQDKKAGQ